MHVKFCGFTQLSDINTAVQLGVDAVGLVFYPPSPRAVTLAQAQILSVALPAFVSVVALVVNMPKDELVELANNVFFDIIHSTVMKRLNSASSWQVPSINAGLKRYVSMLNKTR